MWLVLQQEEIGVAVVLDVDGKLATLDGGGLTGYGISKLIKFGGQVERTEALVSVQVRRSRHGTLVLKNVCVCLVQLLNAGC